MSIWATVDTGGDVEARDMDLSMVRAGPNGYVEDPPIVSIVDVAVCSWNREIRLQVLPPEGFGKHSREVVLAEDAARLLINQLQQAVTLFE